MYANQNTLSVSPNSLLEERNNAQAMRISNVMKSWYVVVSIPLIGKERHVSLIEIDTARALCACAASQRD